MLSVMRFHPPLFFIISSLYHRLTLPPPKDGVVTQIEFADFLSKEKGFNPIKAYNDDQKYIVDIDVTGNNNNNNNNTE
jgi:hypothetical protein